jgi:hypothetical protein
MVRPAGSRKPEAGSWELEYSQERAVALRKAGKRMLKGSRKVLVKKVQPISIHGQISLDVYFVDPEDPDGQVSVARVGPESAPTHMESGDLVEIHYVLGAVTSVTRPVA